MIEVTRGEGPLVLGLPHTGTELPDDVAAELNETGLALADTDWHIHRLYIGLLDDVTTVRTPIHRYAIDVNRGPDDASLYPGQNTTGLCPLTDFDGRAIYRAGAAPDGCVSAIPIWSKIKTPRSSRSKSRRIDVSLSSCSSGSSSIA